MEHIGLYLKDIYFQKKRGSLIFRKENIQKYLFFQEGYLVSAKSNLPTELLGEILFKLGKISEEVHDRIDDYIVPRKRIGEVLVENNIISYEDLKDSLAYQMREIALNIFPVWDAEFRFQEKSDSFGEEFESRINVTFLIEDGIRRVEFVPALKRFLEQRMPWPKSRSFYYRLTENEREIFDALKADVPAESYLGSHGFNPEFFWKSLYLFYCLELIGLKAGEKIEEKQAANKETSIGEAERNLADALALSEKLNQLNFYQILAVAQDASSDEIKKNYYRLARKFHPDLFDRNLPHEMKAAVDELFDQVTRAFKTLSNSQKRKEYDKTLETLKSDDQSTWLKRAELNYNRAQVLFQRGKLEEARILLEEAVRLNSYKGSYFLLLARTESKIPLYRRQAEENFLKALKLEPWNADAYVGLGLLYKQEGLQVKAEKQFQKALKLDPENVTALKELNLSQRLDRKKGLKDIFTRDIFKKKKK